MKYLKFIAITLIATLFFVTGVAGQEAKKELQSVFVDLTKQEGWGPFSPREGFEPVHFTGVFMLAGEKYRVFQIQHSTAKYEERYMIRKVNTDVTFSENEGGIVYYRNGEVELKGTKFDIIGYSKRADQFVLIEKEDVNYIQVGLKQGAAAPLFEAKSLSGKSIALDDYQNKYVLLDFWGTWCGPCLNETAYLKEAHRKFGDKIQFIGIAVDDDKQRLINYLKKNNIKWPQIYIPKIPYSIHPLVNKYKVYGYPAYFLISPDGNVVRFNYAD